MTHEIETSEADSSESAPDIGTANTFFVGVMQITVGALVFAAIAPLLAGRSESGLFDGGPLVVLGVVALAAILIADTLGRPIPGIGKTGLTGISMSVLATLVVVLAETWMTAGGPNQGIGPGFVALIGAIVGLAVLLTSDVRSSGRSDTHDGSAFGNMLLLAGALAMAVGWLLPHPNSDEDGFGDVLFSSGARSGPANIAWVLWLLLPVLVALAAIARRRTTIGTAIGAGVAMVVLTIQRTIGLDGADEVPARQLFAETVHPVAVIGAAVWIGGAALAARHRRQTHQPARDSSGRVEWGRAAWTFGVLAALAALGGAFAAGILIGERIQPEQPPPPPDIVIALPDLDVEAPTAAQAALPVMPNVIGLTPDEAAAVISDAEIETTVQFEERGFAGEPGFVLAQQPQPGERNPDSVVLSLAVPVEMPDLIGEPRADAIAQLELTGTRVNVFEQYLSGAQAGLVLEVDPSTGSVPAEVSLIIAAPASSMYLDLLDPIDASCRELRTPVIVGTAEEARGFSCQPTKTDDSMTYILSQRADRITFDVAFTDEAEPQVTSRLLVLADGEQIKAVDIAFEQRTSIELDLDGVTRLEFVARSTTPEEIDFERWPTLLVINPIVEGSAAGLDALQAE